MIVHVVEDDSGVRDALIELVRAHGHPVTAHETGESFVAAGAPGPEDVIFVDLGLPGMTGQDVIRWLRALAEPPRIVAISGRSQADIDAALRALPDLALLRKPLAPDALTEMM